MIAVELNRGEREKTVTVGLCHVQPAAPPSGCFTILSLYVTYDYLDLVVADDQISQGLPLMANVENLVLLNWSVQFELSAKPVCELGAVSGLQYRLWQ